MPRKKATDPALAALEAAPLEPKRKRTRKDGPAPLAEPLEEIAEQIPGLSVGFPAEEPEREPPTPESAAPEPTLTHVQRATADKPTFGPIPERFLNVDRHETAGIRVNRSLDRKTVALQFAEDRLPSRTEKDMLEAVDQPGSSFVYRPERRQWERYDPEQLGANLLDAKELANQIADGRLGRRR